MNKTTELSCLLGLAACIIACGSAPAQAPATPSPPASAAAACASSPAAPPAPPERVAAPTAPPTPPTPTPQEAFATVHGIKMHYWRVGSGPTLVLLHPGLATAEFAWSAAMPFFAQSFDVIAPEQMGHGKTSDDPKRPMLVHTMAEDTVELLGQLGVTSAVFVGWSDGGNLALDIAMHHPQLARKIVATGANFSPAGADPKALVMLKALKVGDFPPEMRDWYAKNSPDGPDHLASLLDRDRKMWLTDPTWTTRDLATIKAPALIAAGDHDSVLTSHTVQMAEAIPGAALAIFPHSGHDVVLADAAHWNAVVLAFLNEGPAKAE